MACHSVLVTIIIAYLLVDAYGTSNTTTVKTTIETSTSNKNAKSEKNLTTPLLKVTTSSFNAIGVHSENSTTRLDSSSNITTYSESPTTSSLFTTEDHAGDYADFETRYVKIINFTADWQFLNKSVNESITLSWSVEESLENESINWNILFQSYILSDPEKLIIDNNCSTEDSDPGQHRVTILPKEKSLICSHNQTETANINVTFCDGYNITITLIGERYEKSILTTQLKPKRRVEVIPEYSVDESKLIFHFKSNDFLDCCEKNYRYNLTIDKQEILREDEITVCPNYSFTTPHQVFPCTNYSISVWENIDHVKLVSFSNQTSKPEDSAEYVTEFKTQLESSNQTCLHVSWRLIPDRINCVGSVAIQLDDSHREEYENHGSTRKQDRYICHLQPGTMYNVKLRIFGKNGQEITSNSISSLSVTGYTSNAYHTSTVGLIVVASILVVILAGFGVHFARKWFTRSRGSNRSISFFSNLGRKRAHPIKLKNLNMVTQRLRSSACHLLEIEFEDLVILADACRYMDSSSAQQPENAMKNRYVNILPYEHSRVPLSLLPDQPYSDYINASYIMGFNDQKEYIASQGPKSCTIEDFWRMIWEQNVYIIVMVTNLEERGKPKCDQYWPNSAENPLILNSLKISHLDETDSQDYTLRSLQIQLNDNQQPKIVKQAFLKGWPDFGVPENPEILVRFIEVVRNLTTQTPSPYPIVVHCSAGVGRTGTFIAVDWLMQEARVQKEIDIFSTVLRMRECRVSMVQSDEQYEYVYRCLAHFVSTRLFSTMNSAETSVSEAATLLTNGNNAAFVESVDSSTVV